MRRRVPGTHRNRRPSVLYVLPSIPDDAPDEVKDALAIRNACATEGKCPACGAIPELSLDRDGLGWLTFHHQPDCPVRDDHTYGEDA